ncbi:serine hydrolase [Streptomyces sp. NPDC051214]|uniref:serine hydrolase n=1 Tax=Streptomyces sp. NPDC051214 TaxID=3155282 RepID=UPI00341D4D82
MAYEEASVAGETPDRSKQRKSSGNPTGAEPSVPAPAPEERDPRLAVAREVPAAREDQATAVFSTKAVTSGAQEREETPKGAKAPEAGDARLRAAVAAWVATADDEPDAEGSAAPAKAAGESGASAAAEAKAAGAGGSGDAGGAAAGSDEADAADEAAGETEASDAAGSGGAAGDAGSSDEAAGSAESAGDADDSGDATASAGPVVPEADDSAGDAASGGDSADATASAEPEVADEPAGAEGDAKDSRDAEAAGASEPSGAAGSVSAADGSGDADDAEPETADAAAGEDGPYGDVSGSRDAGAEPAAAAGTTTDAKPGEPAADAAPADPRPDAKSPEPTADAKPKADTTPSAAAAGAAAAASSAAEGDEPSGGKGSGKTTGTPAPSDSPADAEPAAPKSDAKPSDSPKADANPADPKPGAKRGPNDSTPKPAPTDSTPKPSADAQDDADADGKPSGDGDAPTRGVDQATAVFKALSPKPVDQPTTMLKLGDHKPEAKKPEAKSEAKPSAKPEGDAERTSKFVALKPLDDAAPGAPKPPAKAPAPEKANVGPERTTQQPLPPRPPLDLLAELTNTPPPPETPVRTAVRRVKIWTPLVLLLIVVFAVVQAVRPLPTPTLALTAKETVTFEGGKPSMPWPAKGQAAMDVNGIGTFGTSGDQKPVPIASIAKVMTVYLVLRDHPLKKGNPGPKIPVDAAAEKHYTTGKAGNESVVKVTEGQKITQYEALQAVMLPSANNVAKLLARWDTKSDSEDEFVAKMNKTAKELGMKNTHYTDPSGLDKTTVSTAEDLVKLGRAAMEDPVFNEISRQPSYKDLNGDKQNNFFGLVPTVAIGIKTGTTTAAGGNILFAAEKKVGGETRTIIGAALGQYGENGVANIDQVTGVTRKLIEAGQGALEAKTIVKKGEVVGQVDDGLGGTTPVVATKDVAAAGWSGLTVKLKLGEKAGVTIPHSAKAGTTVGVLSVGDGKEGAVEVPVALQKDLAEPGLGAKLQRVG